MITTKQSVVWLALAGFCVLSTHPFTAADTLGLTAVEKRFEARAFEAAAKLEKLNARLKGMGEEGFRSKEGRMLRLEMMLESAFVGHVAFKEKMQKTVKDGTSNEAKLFHLTLNGGSDAGLFDIVYQYSGDGELQATFINELPRNWTLIFTKAMQEDLVVETESKGRFIFSLRDPFDTTVLNAGATNTTK